MADVPAMIIPPGSIAAISGTVNGRCNLFFNARTDDAMKLLRLFVECRRAEQAELTGADWPQFPDEGVLP